VYKTTTLAPFPFCKYDRQLPELSHGEEESMKLSGGNVTRQRRPAMLGIAMPETKEAKMYG
jgi:hypothetical protein